MFLRDFRQDLNNNNNYTLSIPCDPDQIASAKLYSLDADHLPLSPVSVLAPPSDGSAPDFLSGYPSHPETSFDANSTEINRSTANINIAANKACTLYWALYYADSTESPNSTMFLSDNLPNCIEKGRYSLSQSEIYSLKFSNLRELTDYAVWIWLSAPDASSGSLMRKIPVSTGDSTPPTFRAAPALLETKSNSLTFSFTLSEEATLYWSAFPAGTNMPASREIAINQIVSGENAVRHGLVRALANNPSTFSATGLSPENDYDIWFIAQDTSDNYSNYPAGNPNNADDPTSPRLTSCITASTLDTVAPSVTQEFTHYPLNSPGAPYADTSVKLIFSEPIRLTEKNINILDLYAAVADASSDAELNAARDALADALRDNIILYIHDPSNSSLYSSVQERDSSNQNNHSLSWTIDYRFARVESDADGKKIILTLPTTNEISGAPTSALSLIGGKTYHFEISGFSDTSENANAMLTTRLNHFTTASPKAELSRLSLRASSYPAGVDTIDMAFSVSPVSTSRADENAYWDLILWSDTSAEYEIYTRSRPADSSIYDFSWRLVQDITGESASTEITVPAGVTSAGSSLHYHAQKLRESEIPDLSQLKDNRVYEYAIRFLNINGQSNRAAWSGQVTFQISVISGDFTDIWNLAADLTPDQFNTAKRAGTITDISAPDNREFSVSRLFVDSEPPEFIAGRPIFTTDDTSVRIKLLLNRAGTIYYCLAPVDGSLPVMDENHEFVTLAQRNTIPTSGGQSNLIPFKLFSPSYRDVVSARYQDENENIICGSVTTANGIASLDITNLLPETDYFICFVLRGVSQVYTPYAQLFRFNTSTAAPPVLSGRLFNPVIQLSSSRPARLDYIFINPSAIQILSQPFWNADPSGFVNPPYDAYQNISNVLRAMSANCIDSDASVFDQYASQEFKNQVALYIRNASQDSQYIPAAGHDINLNANQIHRINFADLTLAQNTRYALAAVVSGAAGYAFRAVMPITKPDSTPPEIININNALKMDVENQTQLDTCSGRVTLTFDEILYFQENDTTRRPIDNGPVSSPRRAAFPDFIGMGELISNASEGKADVYDGDENQVGQNAEAVMIQFTNAKDGDFITFNTNLCDADGNTRSADLTVRIKIYQLSDGTYTPQVEITSAEWIKK